MRPIEKLACTSRLRICGTNLSGTFNTAKIFWTAYREGVFGKQPRPFVGWMMLVEDAPESRTPVVDRSPHFPLFPEFNRASYLKRYDILCQRLVQEQLYTTASIITAPRTAADTGEYAELSE
jgi:hypothetical protein